VREVLPYYSRVYGKISLRNAEGAPGSQRFRQGEGESPAYAQEAVREPPFLFRGIVSPSPYPSPLKGEGRKRKDEIAATTSIKRSVAFI